MVKLVEAPSDSGSSGEVESELPRSGRGEYAQAWNKNTRQFRREAKMSALSAGRNPWSVSLRELLAAVALTGIACVSLQFANDWFWIGLSSAAMLLFMAATVVAFVGRGAVQAFAIGFVLCTTLYCGALLASGRDREMDPHSGSLPTSKLLRPAYEAVVKVDYYMPFGDPTKRFATHAEAVAYQSANGATAVLGFGGGNGIVGLETPMRQDFMAVGHVWWAVLIGYVGGRFARVIYLRRVQESR